MLRISKCLIWGYLASIFIWKSINWVLIRMPLFSFKILPAINSIVFICFIIFFIGHDGNYFDGIWPAI